MVSVRIFQLREVPVGNLRADHVEVTVFAKLTKKARKHSEKPVLLAFQL